MTDYDQTKVSFREMLAFLIDKGYETIIESWCVTNKEFNERVEMLYNALNCNNVDMTHWHDPKKELPEDGELVLIYGRVRYTDRKSMAIITYRDRWKDNISKGFGLSVPYAKDVEAEKWMRIPPVE